MRMKLIFKNNKLILILTGILISSCSQTKINNLKIISIESDLTKLNTDNTDNIDNYSKSIHLIESQINYSNINKFNDIKLFNNWYYKSSNISCTNYSLTIYNEIQSDTFNITNNLENNYFSKLLDCSLNSYSANVMEAILINDKYFAFRTTLPGYIFFNYKKGKFENIVLKTNGCDIDFYTNESSDMLIKEYNCHSFNNSEVNFYKFTI